MVIWSTAETTSEPGKGRGMRASSVGRGKRGHSRHFALVEAFVRARAARLGVSLLARPGEVTAGGPVLTLRGQVGGASSDFPRALPAPANLSLTS
jgi:hypothetical protein